MQEHREAVWGRLPEHCEKLGDDIRRRVDRRLWAKFDVSGFGNSIAADALLHRDQFRGTTDAELLAWLRRIAQRKLLEKWRHWLDAKMRDLRREQPLSPADDSQATGFEAGFSFITPSRIAVRNEHAELVNRALSQLEPEYAEALALFYEMGLTRREIAELLDITAGQVANRVRTGLKRLREQLAQLGLGLEDV
jgi:RNA polymerase sigma-70 factor (ECF subfamily)